MLGLLVLALLGGPQDVRGQGADDANAIASVHIGCVVPYVIDDFQSGAKTAHAQGSGSSPEGSVYSGLATVGLGVDSPFLAAAVFGQAPGDRVKYAPWRTGGGARASLYDELTVGLLIPSRGWEDRLLPSSVEVSVTPRVSGTVSGNAEAVFRCTLASGTNSFQYVRDEQSWDPGYFPTHGPEGHSLKETGDKRLTMTLWLDYKFVPDLEAWLVTSDPVACSMSLEVSATSYPGEMSSNASYEHTAELGAVQITGPGGSPLPEFESLTLTSAAGATYRTELPAVRTDFVVTSLTGGPGAGKVGLTWVSKPGTGYRVQRSTDLITWGDLGDVTVATSSSTAFTDDAPPSNSGGLFYRVKTVP